MDNLDIRFSVPIGHPLPIKQNVATSADTVAWARNYGRSWVRSAEEIEPAASSWQIERFERLGDVHPSRQHTVGMASVADDESGDVLVVYDTNFTAQMWRMSREKAVAMWPDLYQHAVKNAPAQPQPAPERAPTMWERIRSWFTTMPGT